METKYRAGICLLVRRALVMDFSEYVELRGIAGTLTLWWTQEVNIQILYKAKLYRHHHPLNP